MINGRSFLHFISCGNSIDILWSTSPSVIGKWNCRRGGFFFFPASVIIMLLQQWEPRQKRKTSNFVAQALLITQKKYFRKHLYRCHRKRQFAIEMSRNGNAYYYYSDDKVREVQRKLNYMVSSTCLVIAIISCSQLFDVFLTVIESRCSSKGSSHHSQEGRALCKPVVFDPWTFVVSFRCRIILFATLNRKCVFICRNDEKYSYLKASFKQQFSPSQSSTKHFDFDGKSTHSPARDESNHNRYGSGHYGSGPLNRAQDQGDTRSSNVSSTLQTQLVQNILSTSPTHRPQHDVSDHPLVHELSRRGLTSSCKKRKTQTEVRREVETKLLFSWSSAVFSPLVFVVIMFLFFMTMRCYECLADINFSFTVF